MVSNETKQILQTLAPTTTLRLLSEMKDCKVYHRFHRDKIMAIVAGNTTVEPFTDRLIEDEWTLNNAGNWSKALWTGVQGWSVDIRKKYVFAKRWTTVQVTAPRAQMAAMIAAEKLLGSNPSREIRVWYDGFMLLDSKNAYYITCHRVWGAITCDEIECWIQG